jgi:hypothetical protein
MFRQVVPTFEPTDDATIQARHFVTQRLVPLASVAVQPALSDRFADVENPTTWVPATGGGLPDPPARPACWPRMRAGPVTTDDGERFAATP